MSDKVGEVALAWRFTGLVIVVWRDVGVGSECRCSHHLEGA